MSYTVQTWVYINENTDNYECIVMGHSVRDDGTHEIWRTRTDLVTLVVTEFPTYGDELREYAEEVYAEGEVGYTFWIDEKSHKGWLTGHEFFAKYLFIDGSAIMRGLLCGFVRLDNDDDGFIICRIGDHGFRIIGELFKAKPFEYVSVTPIGSIIEGIAHEVNALCDYGSITEWLYYRRILNNE